VARFKAFEPKLFRDRRVFFNARPLQPRMKSIRKALRDGDLEKDTYERIVCANCEKSLGRRNEPDEIGDIRVCPECGAEYKQIK
jgi:hypothetical protein